MSMATCKLLALVVGSLSQALVTFHTHKVSYSNAQIKIQQLSLPMSQVKFKCRLFGFPIHKTPQEMKAALVIQLEIWKL